MRRRLAAVTAAWLLAAGTALAQDAAPVSDIPQVRYRPTGAPVRPPLRRTADLLLRLWRGEGRLTDPGGPARPLHAAFSFYALPWPSPDAASLVLRRLSGVAEEVTLSLRLRPGASWCSPSLELPAGSRLRLDALSLEAAGRARLVVSLSGAGAPRFEAAVDAARPDEPGGRVLDLALPAGRGELCLRAENGAVAIGEPRVVSPEPPGSDSRPRWIVLVVGDALRADVLTRPDAARLAPALARLSQRGLRYEEAVSPGAHTQAALFPLLTGRHLARIDPVRAHRFTPAGTPLDLVYSRPNLAVSHLAQAAGYHPVFLGNNSFLVDSPLFARTSNRGSPETGTVDTIEALPSLLARYADERVFLVYYLSTPHNFSATPRRLAERYGCASRAGVAAARCLYDARVAHADEAVEALELGLEDHGLAGQTLTVLTADHGEVFGDGRAVEARIFGKWWRLDEGHGGATHWNEIHVPLVVAGPGSEPGSVKGRVSTLDVVPTLAAIGKFPTPQRLDGQVLPRLGGSSGSPGPLVSFGYCTHSAIDGPDQLVVWDAECTERRELGGQRPVPQRAELWRNGSLAATDATDPERLAPLVKGHLEWLAARLPGEAWMLDASGLGRARVRVTVPEGRITDWGPASGPARLDGVTGRLVKDGELVLELDGPPAGLTTIATWPRSAAVRFDVEPASPAPPTLVGGLQLPVPLLGRLVDPDERPDLWLAPAPATAAAAKGPLLRVWRQAYSKDQPQAERRGLTELDRVLREWGYIR